MTDRSTALAVLAALQRTPVGGDAVLVGSSGLFGFTTSVPALTEDVDIAVDVEVVERDGEAIVEALEQQGYSHEPGTATFSSDDGITFDLLGHGQVARGDYVTEGGSLRVMVFEDISRVVGQSNATMRLPTGGRTLTPAGFVTTKLLTERGYKGSKDKIQALLLIAERRLDDSFFQALSVLLRGLDSTRLEDLQASAQDALFAMAGDPGFRDAGAEGYVPAVQQAEEGFARLCDLLREIHG